MYLFHYYEKGRTPFLNLSDLTDEEAIRLHTKLANENNAFAMRDPNGQYMFQRRIVEKRAYSMFIKKGGRPKRKSALWNSRILRKSIDIRPKTPNNRIGGIKK